MSDHDRLGWRPDDDPRLSSAEVEAELGSVVARGRRSRARRTAVVGSSLALLVVLVAAAALRGSGDASGVRAVDRGSTTTIADNGQGAATTLVPATPSTTAASAPPQHPRPGFVVVARKAAPGTKAQGEEAHTELAVLDGTSGTPIRTIYRTPFNISELSLSPDGKHVYFVEWNCGTGPIMRVRVDGSPDQQAEKLTGEGSDAPAVAPDGRSLAYLALGQCDGEPRLELRVRDLVTGQEHVVAAEPEGYEMSSPTWAPDGTALAVSVKRSVYPEATGVGRLEAAFVSVLDPTRRQELLGAPRVTSPRQGFGLHSSSYLPDGSLFVVETELGEDDGSRAAAMLVVDARSGQEARRVATGDPKRSYGNTATDATGAHLLYISTPPDPSGDSFGELRVSSHGARTVVLATDVTAADW